jgi:hypothetical protein
MQDLAPELDSTGGERKKNWQSDPFQTGLDGLQILSGRIKKAR